MKIQFLGAAEQVTGSSYLVETEDFRFLIDFGQFQGTEVVNSQNYQPLTFDPKTIDFVILTHAHIDHCGRLPLLTKGGFTGKIYCTFPTSELANLMLRDSGKIHEEENEFENKKRLKAGLEPIAPLFTEEEAVECAAYLYPVAYHKLQEVGKHLSFEFNDTAHLLGSASLRLHLYEGDTLKTVVFSGDIGTGNNPLLKVPEYWDKADIVVMESTYAMRNHSGVSQRGESLAKLIEEALAGGGSVIIPAFSLGRTQEVLLILKNFYETHHSEGDFERIPIYIDSPLAIEAAKVYKHHLSSLNPEIAAAYQNGFNPMEGANIHYVKSHDASMALHKDRSSKVLISASGMCEAGRIRHHLRYYLPYEHNKVIFVGYQGEGTLGRTLMEGKEKNIRILGDTIPIKAHIHALSGFSGHADSNQLLNWFEAIKGTSRLFVTHGEPDRSLAFSKLIASKHNLEAIVPYGGSLYEF